MVLSALTHEKCGERSAKEACEAPPPKRRRDSPTASPTFTETASSEDESNEYTLSVELMEMTRADSVGVFGSSEEGFRMTVADALQREHAVRLLSNIHGYPDTPFRAVAVQLVLDMGLELCRRPTVRIHSLTTERLNGRLGQLVSFDAVQHRYAVKILTYPGDPAKYRKLPALICGENLELLKAPCNATQTQISGLQMKLELLPVQCLAVDLLDRAMHSFQSKSGNIGDFSSTHAKLLGRDCFSLSIKSQSWCSAQLGLISTSEFGDSALSTVERGMATRGMLDGQVAKREFLLFQQIGNHIDTGASTAADWVTMLLDHVDTVPSPSKMSTSELLKQRGVAGRAESAVRAQLTSARLAQLCVKPSMKAAAAVIVAINEDGTRTLLAPRLFLSMGTFSMCASPVGLLFACRPGGDKLQLPRRYCKTDSL